MESLYKALSYNNRINHVSKALYYYELLSRITPVHLFICTQFDENNDLTYYKLFTVCEMSKKVNYLYHNDKLKNSYTLPLVHFDLIENDTIVEFDNIDDIIPYIKENIITSETASIIKCSAKHLDIIDSHILNIGDNVKDIVIKLLELSKECYEKQQKEYEELKEEVSVLEESNTQNITREKIEKLIYNIFNKLDKTGINTKKYQALFNSMNDAQWNTYMRNFLKDPKSNFYMEILPNKNEPSLKDVESALELLKVPTDEYVYYRDGENKNNPLRTRYKVPVMYVHMKRLRVKLKFYQQISYNYPKKVVYCY